MTWNVVLKTVTSAKALVHWAAALSKAQGPYQFLKLAQNPRIPATRRFGGQAEHVMAPQSPLPANVKGLCPNQSWFTVHLGPPLSHSRSCLSVQNYLPLAFMLQNLGCPVSLCVGAEQSLFPSPFSMTSIRILVLFSSPWTQLRQRTQPLKCTTWGIRNNSSCMANSESCSLLGINGQTFFSVWTPLGKEHWMQIRVLQKRISPPK